MIVYEAWSSIYMISLSLLCFIMYDSNCGFSVVFFEVV